MQQIVSLLVPLLLIIALGFLAGKFKILPPETGHVLTQYLFYFSVPCLSFSNIYQSNIQVLLNPNILLTFFCTIVTVILLQGLLYTRVFHIRGQELVMLTLGGFYMNAIYMGVPVTTAVLGSAIPSLIPFFLQASFFFPLAVYLMDRFSGRKTDKSLLDVLLVLVRNPILIASLIALFSLALKIQFPAFVLETTKMMGAPAAVTGLFALGFTCNLPAGSVVTRHEFKMAVIATLFKILVQPLVAFLLGKFVFRLDPWWVTAAVICAMLPTAVNHFILSQKYKSCGNESRLIVLLAMIGSCIMLTLFLLANSLS